MAYKVEVVLSPKLHVGEGPHWDGKTQNLYYIDLYGKDTMILRYDFAENKVYAAKIDGEPMVTFIIPVANTMDQFAVGIGRRVGVIQWDGKSPEAKVVRIAFEVHDGEEDNRFNDRKADPVGRLYSGTMHLDEKNDHLEKAFGSVYKYKKDEGGKALLHGIHISNGLTWNEKSRKFYYIDSYAFNIREYDYDPSNGDISNERVVIDFPVDRQNPEFIPDGMTIDTDGNLFVATFSGSKVLKINPETGKILQEIEIPAKQVTSVTFGGPNCDILFVTTATTARDSVHSAEAGHLIKVTGLGAKGLPGVEAVV